VGQRDIEKMAARAIYIGGCCSGGDGGVGRCRCRWLYAAAAAAATAEGDRV